MKILGALLIISVVSFAHPGIGIVEDSHGNLFYTDLKQVWKIDLSGKKSVVVPNVHTHELYMDQNDNLYGEHLWYNGETKNTWGYFVWSLAPNGKVEKVIPDAEGFRDNYSFVRDGKGTMFKADRNGACQKVMKGDGKTFSQHGQHCYHNIRNLMVTMDGDVIVVDFQDLIKVDAKGNVRAVAARIADKSAVKSSVSNQNSVMGIWDDTAGNIYAAVYSNRVVKKFPASGKEEIIYKSNFPWAPSGGMVSRNGDLCVLEGSLFNDVRVVRVSSAGTALTF